MSSRGRWVRAAAVTALFALLIGRFLAVTTANRLWSASIGLSSPHAEIANLRFALLFTAFTLSLLWCIGHLYFIYRAVGSIHVPRRLGNLEILEELPRSYLAVGLVTLGVILAAVLSRDAGSWWYARTLSLASGAPDITEPVLGRELSYYLFRLPWQRTVHSFVTVACGTMLAVTLGLYTLMGAMRWSGRKLRVNDLARVHVAVLLAAFALALFWGYRLEPAEYVAGIPSVPYDSVLTDIRLPVARLLSSLALVVLGASLLWVWTSRIAPIVASWSLLAGVSLVGHFIVPGFAGTVRQPTELQVESLAEAQRQFVRTAFGPISWDTLLVSASIPQTGDLTQKSDRLMGAPVWDSFALQTTLKRATDQSSSFRYADPQLDAYPGPDGSLVPVFVATREMSLDMTRFGDIELSWQDVHAGRYTHASGVVAIHAAAIGGLGTPEFVPDLMHPDSTIGELKELDLTDPELIFAPGIGEFAVVPASDEAKGIVARGFWQRLALAWVLQSPRLAISSVASTTSVVWERDVAKRLSRAAPFAEFSKPRPVISHGRVFWVSNGYVKSELFPFSIRVDWHGEQVRYLRAGMIGVVDARSGETAVYLAPDADLLSVTWARLAPDIVRSPDRLPKFVLQHLQYPEELFAIQVELLREIDFGGDQRGALTARVSRKVEPFWWFGRGLADPLPRQRLSAAVEWGEPPILAGLVEGSMVDGKAVLGIVRFDSRSGIPGPSQLVQQFARVRSVENSIAGPIKIALVDDEVLLVQSSYSSPSDDAVVRLTDVILAWGAVVERGGTLEAAVERVGQAQLRSRGIAGTQWTEARMWFERMDRARRDGDWEAFGKAYEALKAILDGGQKQFR